METRTAKQWVSWILDNNQEWLDSVMGTRSYFKQLSEKDAYRACELYIQAMIKKDGKRGILYQEKKMIHELGLEV